MTKTDKAPVSAGKAGVGQKPAARAKIAKEKWIAASKALVFLAALIPFGKLLWLGFNDGLGANPIEKITHTTGWWTLTFLMATLTATPLRALSGWGWPLRFRRMLGLYAFFYACLHFSTYLVLDQFFDWPAIVKDIAKRPYITVGFPAFVLLIPLAVTSTNKMVQRLGAKRWKQLHRLVYLIAPAGVVHFWWLVKKDVTEPLQFAVVAAVLLGFRVVVAARKPLTRAGRS
jgi:sulfoxide reductase heme-binding subunit YedZ